MSAALPFLVLAALCAIGLWLGLARWARAGGRRTLLAGMRLTSLAAWGGLAAGCAVAFYGRYWIWRDCFNDEGRCYDGEAGVMVAQAGPIWGGLFVVFATLALRSLIVLRRGSG